MRVYPIFEIFMVCSGSLAIEAGGSMPAQCAVDGAQWTKNRQFANGHFVR
ncbi:hypothetical protein C4K22_5589 [Pseudomonas chlororaphis subsp. aurantiaca]|nr:hypothetical protein C4K24_5380 [Pseudomonas chlororaphis subsp. aurantiaca]AZD38297.1 hypothetical protein C4K22_5589 [Pseudomonas chlororaphis subsp. aurantiaca]AZD44638.1 hypothetical protein C4K21_5599 [Pseudomonas chlororaphis subsp. aurantiaca]